MTETGCTWPPTPSAGDAAAWKQVDRAHRLLRFASSTMDRIAAEEGWPSPFHHVRYLVLAHLDDGTSLGLTPTWLSDLLAVGAPTLNHHLNVLESARLVVRRPLRLADDRKVSVRLTNSGRYVVRRLETGLQVINRRGVG